MHIHKSYECAEYQQTAHTFLVTKSSLQEFTHFMRHCPSYNI